MIGTDIVYLPRISPDSRFCDYVLSSEEKKEFESRQNERRFLFADLSILTNTATAIFTNGISISSSVSKACLVSIGLQDSSYADSGRNESSDS